MPGAVMEQRLKMSDKTVAHCTFFTNSGIMLVSSDFPSEWLKAQAQWISLIAGWVSCNIKSQYEQDSTMKA
jgi:hypothetical protein